jgi:hypothetical protein
VKVLVVTFKPAVEDAWQTDLQLTRGTLTAGSISLRRPGLIQRKQIWAESLVYFGSFQDLLGRDKAGNIKSKNAWLHTTNWDLVIFDEYHFGAWRDSAKELFEGEDDSQARKEIVAQYGGKLERFNEEMLRTG